MPTANFVPPAGRCQSGIAPEGNSHDPAGGASRCADPVTSPRARRSDLPLTPLRVSGESGGVESCFIHQTFTPSV